MLSQSRLVKISKYLSYHLRHRPDELELTLEQGGWVQVDQLLAACSQHDFSLSYGELQEVVQKNDKQRFSFDETGQRIRANQGHSTTVDLQLDSVSPPEILYHGTSAKAVASILKMGLSKMARHHVHLTPNLKLAKEVGQRYGKPIVFQIDARAMEEVGYNFYCSENGVWLVDHVPPQYLKVIV